LYHILMFPQMQRTWVRFGGELALQPQTRVSIRKEAYATNDVL
jgi:hypothetical protein